MITTAPSDFRAALPQGGRLLGLDVGTKTIGTALCDAGWSFASPALLVRRTHDSDTQHRESARCDERRQWLVPACSVR